MKHQTLNSPVGRVTVSEEDGQIVALGWGGQAQGKSDVLAAAASQIEEYFGGERQAFDLPLRFGQTDFQRRFLAALCAIPFGETRTYGQLGKDLGVSAQAIGQACGANPIPIIIPCHRVLGAGGLGGFSGGVGVDTKVELLRHEGAASLLI